MRDKSPNTYTRFSGLLVFWSAPSGYRSPAVQKSRSPHAAFWTPNLVAAALKNRATGVGKVVLRLRRRMRGHG
jgi:hypothetical protein